MSDAVLAVAVPSSATAVSHSATRSLATNASSPCAARPARSRRAIRASARNRGSRVTTSSAWPRVGPRRRQRADSHQENRPVEPRIAEATTVIEYLVDGRGRRVGKKVNGVLVKQWLWRGQLQPVAELDGAGNVVARFVYAGGVNVPSLMVTSTATYKLVRDHLGSVRSVVDASSGAVLQEVVYDSWGRVLIDTNPGLQPFGYAGGLVDQHTRLVRFGARNFEAEIGRWTSKDPIRFRGGVNLYAYSNDDPVNYRDPRGLDAGGGTCGEDMSCPDQEAIDPECGVTMSCEGEPDGGAELDAAEMAAVMSALFGVLPFLTGCGNEDASCPDVLNPPNDSVYPPHPGGCQLGYDRCILSSEKTCCEAELRKCRNCPTESFNFKSCGADAGRPVDAGR
jgi:RHS repeat-associated protein